MTVSTETGVVERARAYADRIEEQALNNDAALSRQGSNAIGTVCVIGGGHMGIGIATALLQSDLAVTMIETQAERIANARERIRRNWASQVKRGKLTEEHVEKRMRRFSGVLSLADASGCDVFIEAVWEDMALKQQIFSELSQIAGKGAVLATNTSTLDIDAIAAATDRPQDVIGLHFFNPAHVMRLLEVVRGAQTSDRALEIAHALARRLGKIPVVVGVCYGFVGNRIFAARDAQNAAMLLEGASPADIDAAMIAFGFPLGPFALQDMAGGIELSWRVRQASGVCDPIGDAIYEAGRLGSQTGKGYYRYEPGDRTPIPDPQVDAIVANARAQAGIVPRRLSREEITDRMILPMINEAAKILDEGVARSTSDVDLVWNTGFGWPRDKGGITFFADYYGMAAILQRLRDLEARHGTHFTPAPLLERMAREGQTFGDLPRNDA